MELEVFRYASKPDFTLGALLIDGKFECFTLEDEYRRQKKHSETRIPDGRYRLGLRKEGGFHNRYSQRFGPDFHKGMLQVLDVPGFEYILIHIGNTDRDTAGCLLVGESANGVSGTIMQSTDAYKRMYPKVVGAMLREEPVHITYRTIDNPPMQ